MGKALQNYIFFIKQLHVFPKNLFTPSKSVVSRSGQQLKRHTKSLPDDGNLVVFCPTHRFPWFNPLSRLDSENENGGILEEDAARLAYSQDNLFLVLAPICVLEADGLVVHAGSACT